MIDMQPVLERLTRARKNAGLSQAQVAKMLLLASPSSFTPIEQGGASLTLERFLILCEIYDVEPVWVLIGINPHFDPKPLIQAVQRLNMASGELGDLLELLSSIPQDES